MSVLTDVVFGIVATCHRKAPLHIVEVKARPSVANPRIGPDFLLGESQEVRLNRAEVLLLMKLGVRFFTVTFQGTVAKRGAEVLPVKVGDDTYLRTVRDEVTEDNLGELPEYKCALSES